MRSTTTIKSCWRDYLKYVEWQKTQRMITTGPQMISRFCFDNILGCLQDDQERWFFWRLGGLKYKSYWNWTQSLDSHEKPSKGFPVGYIRVWVLLDCILRWLDTRQFWTKSQNHTSEVLCWNLDSFPLFRVYKLKCRTHCCIYMGLCTTKIKSDLPALAEVDMPKILSRIWNKGAKE